MATGNVPLSWNIALSAWVIQDGNYPDFRVGEIVEFAVQFYQEDGVSVHSSAGDISSTLLQDTTYDVVSEVVLKTETIAVLDIGILVYRHHAPHPRTPCENRFRTQLALEVDPYFYFEGLGRLANVPPLIYSWRVKSILRQTAPFIEVVGETGPWAAHKWRFRDRTKMAFREISETDAWNDDSGFAEYILGCELLPIAPKRTSATACPIPTPAEKPPSAPADSASA